MQELSTTTNFHLHYDPLHQCLVAQWVGRQSATSIRAHCVAMLTEVQRTGCPRILNDSSQDLDGWSNLVDWLATDYSRQLAAHGVRAVAWVLPRHLPAQIDARQVARAVAQPVTDVFADVEAASQWLQQF
ncbi:MAG: hypothetical protein EOO59_08595 [Hymenobacter sp.]|nr:MAG: hypothetical protein EOO59_08595 [Hymenobacter sp.]